MSHGFPYPALSCWADGLHETPAGLARWLPFRFCRKQLREMERQGEIISPPYF